MNKDKYSDNICFYFILTVTRQHKTSSPGSSMLIRGRIHLGKVSFRFFERVLSCRIYFQGNIPKRIIIL